MANEVALTVNNLTKRYNLNRQVQGHAQTIEALKNVSFEIKQGEKWGIIGRNGSGKSTLLKILAGIIKPSAGKVGIYGSMSYILDVGSNFIPELSGRENVGIFFQLHGVSKADSEIAIQNVIDFAGINEFFDETVKNYSSGMYLRLAFAANLQLMADILLVDEVFSVGDAEFREKIKVAFYEKINKTLSLLLVSHNPDEILEFCSHCIWMDKGEIIKHGPAQEVIAAYYYQLAKEHSEKNYLLPAELADSQYIGVAPFAPVENEFLKITGFNITAMDGSDKITFETGIKFSISTIKKQAGITLHPQIIVYDYLMKPVLMIIPHAQSLSENKIRELKNTMGEINYETHLTPHILTFGNFYAELRFGKDDSIDKIFNEEAIRLPMKIQFEAMQGKYHDYIGGTGNVFVKPFCDWDIRIL